MTTLQFKWDNKSKPVGKVFARKRSKIQAENKNEDSSPTPPNQKKINENKGTFQFKKQVSIEQSPNEHPTDAPKKRNFEKSTSPTEFGYVRRKAKKDKLALKDAAETGEQSSKSHSQPSNYSLFSNKHKNIYINPLKGKSVVEEVFSEDKKFSDLNIHKYIVSNLIKHSFTTITNVQGKSIPLILEGNNVLIRSQTGSGKTLAYAVPILDALLSIEPKLARNAGVQALIIVPTRELAIQTHELFGKINTFQWLVVGHLCGGENRKTEKDRLRKGIHVLIATPGRLLDHMLHTTAFKIDKVRCLVLDEADRLLDMGFKKDIVKIVEELDKVKINSEYDPIAMLKKQIKPKDQEQKVNGEEDDEDKKPAAHLSTNLPPLRDINSKTRQTILLSATLNKGIAELADFTMKDHIYVDALGTDNNVNPDHMVIPKTVKQEFIVTYIKHRLFTLSAMLLAKTKNKSKIFVFMATSQMVDYHYELFKKLLVKMPINRGKLKTGDVVLLEENFDDEDEEEEIVMDSEFFKLHGSMDQNDRKTVFSGFRNAKKGVLLCTDVAARGLDVPEADCIIQYTGPQSDDDYLHRVGRTARAGKSGDSIIFLTHEEQDFVTRLQNHKVFLTEANPDDYLKHLCDLMEEPETEKAAIALQKRFELGVSKDEHLHKMACFAYSSWSRFYNTYPGNMRSIFNFKIINLGHYVTSFALRETPSGVAKTLRGRVSTIQQQQQKQGKRLNRKLAIHEDDSNGAKKRPEKRKIKSISLTTSEYSSGLKSNKKRKKNNGQD